MQSSKLAALQSLSLNAAQPGAASRQTAQARVHPASGGSAKLPWALLVAVLLGIGGNWYWQKTHGGGGHIDGDNKPAIRTELVAKTGGGGEVHVAAGSAAAKNPIAIGAPVGGRVKEVKINNGDLVKNNQIIVLLDDSAARADMTSAQAELSAASGHYGDMKRLEKLGAATRVDVDAARGAVTIASGRLAPIRQRIAQCAIRASIDGVVLERLTQPGETVGANAVVARIADLKQLVAEVDINEGDLAKIRREQAVKITSDAVADRTYAGTVREIAQTADKSRGTVLVKVDLTVPDQSLKPGMSVKCAFQPDSSAKTHVYISKSALTPQSGVWVVGSNGRVAHRPITTIAAAGSSVEVTSGLNGGERIVVDATEVHEGQTIGDTGGAH